MHHDFFILQKMSESFLAKFHMDDENFPFYSNYFWVLRLHSIGRLVWVFEGTFRRTVQLYKMFGLSSSLSNIRNYGPIHIHHFSQIMIKSFFAKSKKQREKYFDSCHVFEARIWNVYVYFQYDETVIARFLFCHIVSLFEILEVIMPTLIMLLHTDISWSYYVLS